MISMLKETMTCSYLYIDPRLKKFYTCVIFCGFRDFIKADFCYNFLCMNSFCFAFVHFLFSLHYYDACALHQRLDMVLTWSRDSTFGLLKTSVKFLTQ
jgi:hypothetical protein